MKQVSFFNDFGRKRLGLGRESSSGECIDACLQAMQEGVLDVCAQNSHGRYVWCGIGMSYDRWQRVCGLLERARVASSILWESPLGFIYYEFMADIEYFWTDLEAVERFLMEGFCEKNIYRVLVQVVDRRRTWHAGLRRSWLAACTRFD